MQSVIYNWQHTDYEEITSTNDLAQELSKTLPQGQNILLTAKAQTKGRGRRGRNWVSLIGNLFLSQLLDNLKDISHLVFITSLSLAKTLSDILKNSQVTIKWPNDILVDNQKICGILIEKAEHNYTIIGIGVNIVSSPDSADMLYPTTSIKACGQIISRFDFLQNYIKNFNQYTELYQTSGFAEIRRLWLEYAAYIGKEITIVQGSSKKSGIFKTIDEQGLLLLNQEDKTIKISVGDVFYKR